MAEYNVQIKKYVKSSDSYDDLNPVTKLNNIKDLIEDTSNPGCFYRMVNGEKEWINPPLENDTVYKTNERWHGKPVYIKDVKLGATQGSAGSVAHEVTPAGTQIVSVSARMYLKGDSTATGEFMTFPVQDRAQTSTEATCFSKGRDVNIYVSGGGYAGQLVYATVKYVYK